MPAATSLIFDMSRQPVHTLLLHCHVGAMPSWGVLSGEAGHVKPEPEEKLKQFVGMNSLYRSVLRNICLAALPSLETFQLFTKSED